MGGGSHVGWERREKSHLGIGPLVIRRNIAQSITNVGRKARDLGKAVIDLGRPLGKRRILQAGDLVPEGCWPEVKKLALGRPVRWKRAME